MQNREWTFIDKSDWPRGPWDSEPDKKQWTDEVTGLPCLIVRNGMGALCGYVGVPEGHPCFERPYDAVDCDLDESVHGGLTFSDFCAKGEPEHGICHVTDPGENDRMWWLGFDCSHACDLHPGVKRMFPNGDEVYRRVGYVMTECRQLARQLHALGNTEEPAAAHPNIPDLIARIDSYLASNPGRTLYEGHPVVLLAEARDALCQAVKEPTGEVADE